MDEEEEKKKIFYSLNGDNTERGYGRPPVVKGDKRFSSHFKSSPPK